MYISNSYKEDPETTNFFKNKAQFVNFCMKWVVLPNSESYTEETKCNEGKIYPYSCNQEYYCIKRLVFKNA